MIIKQYGLQRTGTNIIRAIVEYNHPDVRVLPTTYGSKHAPPNWPEIVGHPELAYLVTVKDPILWTLAYHRYRRRKALDVPGGSYQPLNPLLARYVFVWAETTAQHMTVRELGINAAIVAHERILECPDWVLRYIEREFDLDHVEDPELFRNGRASRGAEEDTGSALISPQPFSDAERAWHLNDGWREDISDTDLKQLRNLVAAAVSKHPILYQACGQPTKDEL